MCCQHIAENIHKKFGVQYKAPFWQIATQDLIKPLMKLFKPFKEMLHKLKSIYRQLATRTLPLLAFLGLDLAMIRLILLNRLIQPGVIYESSPLFSFLMGYINGVLQHGIKDHSYD
jgi:hypothetical protein